MLVKQRQGCWRLVDANQLLSALQHVLRFLVRWWRLDTRSVKQQRNSRRPNEGKDSP